MLAIGIFAAFLVFFFIMNQIDFGRID